MEKIEMLLREYPEYYIILVMIVAGVISFIILGNMLWVPPAMLIGFIIGIVTYFIYRRS